MEITLQHAVAIPKTWKTQIRNQGKKLDNIKHPVLNKIQKLAKPNRYAYTNLITKIVTNPTISQGKWTEYLETNIESDTWENIFLIPYLCTQETKLRAMQFNILHCVLPTNAFLFRAKLKNTPNCSFCHIQKETIEHLFWDCIKIKNIWLQLADFLQSKHIEYIFTKQNVLLGDTNGPKLIEHLKLIIKEYIYYTKLKQNEPTYTKSLNTIKYKAKIEKFYMKDQEIYLEKWRNILD
jgi:hypothetical protein